jgi:hypothetical protein
MDLIELCHVIANINLHKINYKKIYQYTNLLIAFFSRCNARACFARIFKK